MTFCAFGPRLEENPYGELKNTGVRASREAKDKFNQWQAAQEHGSPMGAYSPSQVTWLHEFADVWGGTGLGEKLGR